jgi:hypothetical protein
MVSTGFQFTTFFTDNSPVVCPVNDCILTIQNSGNNLDHPLQALTQGTLATDADDMYIGPAIVYTVGMKQDEAQGYNAKVEFSCSNGVIARQKVYFYLKQTPNCIAHTSVYSTTAVPDPTVTYDKDQNIYLIRSAKSFFNINSYASCNMVTCTLHDPGCITPWIHVDPATDGVYVDTNLQVWSPAFAPGFIQIMCLKCLNIYGDIYTRDNW